MTDTELIESLEKQLAEAHAELDKQGAAPGQTVHGRIREAMGHLRLTSAPAPAPGLHRERLPDERKSLTRKFRIGEYKGYLTTSEYPDGRLGEVFVKMDQASWPVGSLLDAVATLTSIMLQYGIPLQVICGKLRYTKFEPAGPTGNPEIPFASSLLDYMAHLLAQRYLGETTATVLTDPPQLPAAAASQGE